MRAGEDGACTYGFDFAGAFALSALRRLKLVCGERRAAYGLQDMRRLTELAISGARCRALLLALRAAPAAALRQPALSAAPIAAARSS